MRRFTMVDVFADRPFAGNPLAVVLDGEGLSTEQMLQVTRWLNLSETVFLLPVTVEAADYRVRIFTPAGELPFAGHPTLGSCHSWLRAGGEPKDTGEIVQECGAGLVRIRRDKTGLAFAAPPLLRSGPVAETLLDELAEVLGIGRDDIVDGQWVDNGPGWLALLLEDAETVLALNPDFGAHRGRAGRELGLVGPYPPGSPFAYELRALFGGEHGEMREDPVTGSLNASVAQWMVASGRFQPPYVVSQGTRLGRRGRPRISADASGTIWVGGDTVSLVDGEIDV